jgi:predicted outer membrane lipoprotein
VFIEATALGLRLAVVAAAAAAMAYRHDELRKRTERSAFVD